jgi:hypothetical protein
MDGPKRSGEFEAEQRMSGFHAKASVGRLCAVRLGRYSPHLPECPYFRVENNIRGIGSVSA